MNQQIKILSIDDEAEIRYALGAIFDFEHWNVVMAADVEEGLALFRKHQPDIVLIDYHLPRINGIEGVRMLRRLSPTVPILVFTIDENQEVANRFLEAGATDFALKPIKAPDLISRIRLHIRLLESQQKVPSPESEQPVLAKGIRRTTLELIRDYLKQNPEFITADKIAEGTGLADQTTYRYLQYMASESIVEVNSTYGKVGRPKQGYRLK